jgi:hypothetical protein
MVERRDSWFQSDLYLTRIAMIMATIVEIRQGLSEDRCALKPISL